MTKIYLPNIDNKFFNNLRLINIPGVRIYSGDANNIYKTHSKIAADIYIFDSRQINNEIIQFSIEYTDLNTKIFIYHSHNHINKHSLRFLKQVKHLVENSPDDNFTYDNLIHIPKFIINKNIYYNTNSEKLDRKIYFLDNDTEIPESLTKKLYPKSKDKILMFNNHKLPHAQNMGFLPEEDKSKILNTSKYFICNSQNDYAIEAFVCGCEVLDCENLSRNPIGDTSKIEEHTVSYEQFVKEKIL